MKEINEGYVERKCPECRSERIEGAEAVTNFEYWCCKSCGHTWEVYW